MPVNGRYQLERRIEQGRFEATYAAIDLAHDGAARRVTLTMLPPSIAASEETWSLFRGNCEWLTHLSHESIAAVYDCKAGATGCYVASEYVDGECLRNVIDQLAPETLEPGEADIVVRAVGMALAHAHDRGIAHGDVAPENVIVTGDSRIKLIGFAGPQRCRPFDTETAIASDVHALAALAYELLSGRTPGVRPDRTAVAHLPPYRQIALAAGLSSSGKLSVRGFLAQMRLCDPASQRPTTCDAAPLRSSARAEPLGTPLHLEPDLAPLRSDLAFTRPAANRRDTPPRRRGWVAGLAGGALLVVAFNAGDPGDFSATSAGIIERGPPIANSAAPNPAIAAIIDAESDSDADIDFDSGSRSGAIPPPSSPSPDRRPAGYGPATSSVVAAMPRQPAIAAEPLPLVLIASERMEVVEGQPMARIEVELGPAADAVTIAWWTESGTAKSDEDYGDLGRRLERLDREPAPALALVVPIVSDEIPEPAERFSVHIEAAPQDGSRIERFRIEVTIRDDDASRPPPPRG